MTEETRSVAGLTGIAARMAGIPEVSPYVSITEPIPHDQASRLTDLICQLAGRGEMQLNGAALVKDVATWSARTASMVENLLRDDSEGLAPQRAILVAIFSDNESEAAIQVLCMEPLICERVALMLQTYVVLEEDPDDEESALVEAGSRVAEIIIGELEVAGSSADSVAVTTSLARHAVLRLLYDVMYLASEGGGLATIEDMGALTPEDLDQLTRALWPIHLAQADGLRLTLREMQKLARLNEQSPAVALEAAEFFFERNESDPLAFKGYAQDGAAFADGMP